MAPKKTLFTLTLTLAALLTFSGVSLAQEQQGGSVTEYDFEADDFTARVRSPEGLMLNGEKQRRLRSLIRIRRNFKREIVKAADGI